MSEKNESKQAQVIAYLRTGESEGKSNPQIAAMFDCNEGTVRRARRIVEAEAQADRMISEGVNSDEALATLRAVLSAGSYIDEIDTIEEELREELKELKAIREDAARKEKAVRKQAEERFPLFENAAQKEAKSGVLRMVAQSA